MLHVLKSLSSLFRCGTSGMFCSRGRPQGVSALQMQSHKMGLVATTSEQFCQLSHFLMTLFFRNIWGFICLKMYLSLSWTLLHLQSTLDIHSIVFFVLLLWFFISHLFSFPWSQGDAGWCCGPIRSWEYGFSTHLGSTRGCCHPLWAHPGDRYYGVYCDGHKNHPVWGTQVSHLVRAVAPRTQAEPLLQQPGFESDLWAFTGRK